MRVCKIEAEEIFATGLRFEVRDHDRTIARSLRPNCEVRIATGIERRVRAHDLLEEETLRCGDALEVCHGSESGIAPVCRQSAYERCPRRPIDARAGGEEPLCTKERIDVRLQTLLDEVLHAARLLLKFGTCSGAFARSGESR